MKKNLLFSVVFCTAVVSGSVSTFGEAAEVESVAGKSYLVQVKRPIGLPTSDCFVFNEDGSFISTGGFEGTWSQTELGPIAMWNADTRKGIVDVEWKGIQLSRLLAGRGTFGRDRSYVAVGTEDDCVDAIPPEN